MKKIRVLIVDDSALIRQILRDILNHTDDIEVVATAADPLIARRKIKQFNPDVITLDVEMPHMDGLAFLDNIMRLRPMPVIMVSALTEQGADITLQALELGAVDYVSKPRIDVAQTFSEYADEIADKIRAATKANITAPNLNERSARLPSRHTTNAEAKPTTINIPPKYSADIILKQTDQSKTRFRTTERIIAIGASTGGTEAIKYLLSHLPADSPGVVISQHIPKTFSSSFARRMNQLSAMTVREAYSGDVIEAGHVYIAPGSQHLLVKRVGTHYVCELDEGNPVNRHRPSVDVLFRSIAQNVGPNAIGVLLTGMGDDGARGLTEMHDIGAITFAQDEKSSVVWGMPGEAVKRGAVDYVVSLQQLPEKLCSVLSNNKK